MQQLAFLGEILPSITFISVALFLFQVEIVASSLQRNTTSRGQSCYTCTEPLIGYSKYKNSQTYLETIV